jgi:hypothetical protein
MRLNSPHIPVRILPILITFMSLKLFAQTQLPVPSISDITSAFQNLDYKRTLNLTDAATERFNDYNTDELVLIYQFRALSFYYIGQEDDAKNAFISLLSIRPDHQLDPVMVSPKIIQFYEKLKIQNREEVSDNTRIQIRYVQLQDPRPGAGWRSLVLPGWGQIYKQQETKGYVILSAFALNAVALITSIVKENDAHNVYRGTIHPDEIDRTYDEYNKWHRTRQYLTYSQVIIWAFAVGDAIWHPLPATSLTVTPQTVNISYQF